MNLASPLGTPARFDAVVGEIGFVRRRASSPDWQIRDLVNRRYSIIALAVSGRARYECGGEPFVVQKGHMLLFPKGMRHSARSDPGSPWSFFSAGFQLIPADEAAADAFDRLPNWTVPKNFVRALELFEELDRLWSAQEAGYLLASRSRLLDLLHVVVQGAVNVSRSIPHSRRLEAVVQQLQEQPARNYRVEDLAEQAGLSPSRFRVLFKALTGHSIVRYQNWLRVNKAKDLLLSGEYSVAEAAAEVGFDDTYYFSRLFKKMTGFAPSHYRNL
ncbi:MAG: AraC family transcriptional regulator [Thermoguttaceae bacterium]|nr:AraC family transcriptional regulator [Thermoguttaceae bacterium]